MTPEGHLALAGFLAGIDLDAFADTVADAILPTLTERPVRLRDVVRIAAVGGLNEVTHRAAVDLLMSNGAEMPDGWWFVDQTIIADDPSGTPGNCWQACIASLLRLPLDEVPHFVADDPGHYPEATEAWASEHGFDMVEVSLPWLERHPETYVMLTGYSPRGVSHAVVGRGLDLVHDPHPSRGGLSTVRGGILFAPRT